MAEAGEQRLLIGEAELAAQGESQCTMEFAPRAEVQDCDRPTRNRTSVFQSFTLGEDDDLEDLRAEDSTANSFCDECQSAERLHDAVSMAEELKEMVQFEAAAHELSSRQEACVEALRQASAQKDEELTKQASLIDLLRNSAQDHKNEVA